jgi:hypothetical protein
MGDLALKRQITHNKKESSTLPKAMCSKAEPCNRT